jgi:Holliday junction resolvasome RuvABC ATP-dependent DNA helicase subunit
LKAEELVFYTISAVTQVVKTVANTRRRGAPYQNLLLYGPPGTGKSMFAERLAKAVGMDYAMLSGGDVVPLGKQASAVGLFSQEHYIFPIPRTAGGLGFRVGARYCFKTFYS